MRRHLIVSLAAVLSLAACSGAQRTATPAREPAGGERYVIRQTLVPDLKPVAATVTTRNMGEARARIGGTLVRLSVREGDVVTKGQVVAVVADQRLTHETSAYAAQAAAAAAENARAQAALTRVNALYDKGFYSKAALEQAQAQAKAAAGQMEAARAQRAASAELAAQGAILAPTNGRVLHADVPVGSVVSQGQSVATITAGEPLLRLEIPEAQGRALKVGAKVSVRAEDLPGAAPQGEIVQVYPAVTDGRVVADIRVKGLSGDLVGSRARVNVELGKRRALVAPQRFVSTRYGVDFVRVLGADGRVAEVAVQLTPATPGMVEILSGLKDGDVLLSRAAA